MTAEFKVVGSHSGAKLVGATVINERSSRRSIWTIRFVVRLIRMVRLALFGDEQHAAISSEDEPGESLKSIVACRTRKSIARDLSQVLAET